MWRLYWNLGASTSRNPQGLSRPEMGLLYLYPENFSPITTASQNGSSSALNNVNVNIFVHLPFAAVRVTVNCPGTSICAATSLHSLARVLIIRGDHPQGWPTELHPKLLSTSPVNIISVFGMKPFWFKPIFCSDIRYTCINPLKTKRRPLYLKTQSVSRCKRFPSRL
jgi:hypothetical protein